MGLLTVPRLPGREFRMPPQSGRIVLALTEREQRLFFRGGAKGWPGGTVRWLQDVDEDEEARGRRWRAFLEAQRPGVLVTGWSTPPLPRDWVVAPDCPLAYVCHVAGSVRSLVPREFLERGGKVTNWGGLPARQVAEHALLLALAALRGLPRWRELEWVNDGPTPAECLETRTLFGREVGLHGLGAVACALLEVLQPFGVKARGFSAGVPRTRMLALGVEPCGTLVELFSRSEVLFECEALTPQSAGSVGAEELAALPDGAVFVNVGRGQVVDEPALVREAGAGRILAALDVMAEEPLPADSALARVPGIILSPHIAGPTLDTLPCCGDLALRNLDRFLMGLPLENELSLEVYDRST